MLQYRLVYEGWSLRVRVSDKNQIKKNIYGLQRIKTWQLIILLIIVGFIAATFFRLNSIGMVQRREAVISADEVGDSAVTLDRLYDLQRYVASHMNTDLGRGVYLEYSFNRDVQNWYENQYGDSNPNGNIYKKAQEVCAPQFSYYSYAYLQCTTNELAKYPAAQDPATDSSRPRQEAYIHDFEAPIWTPDFAGWSVALFVVISLVIVGRFVSLLVLKLLLSRNYKRL